jgi:hypothetical protein
MPANLLKSEINLIFKNSFPTIKEKKGKDIPVTGHGGP